MENLLGKENEMNKLVLIFIAMCVAGTALTVWLVFSGGGKIVVYKLGGVATIVIGMIAYFLFRKR